MSRNNPVLDRLLFPILPIAVFWLLLISFAHVTLNGEETDRRVVKMGYMPVITNLAAPILDHLSKEGEGTRFKALKFSSFAEMAESLRNGQIDAGFMIAPLSIVLRQQGAGIKVVYIGNRHESTFVTRKDLNIKTLDDLVGKTVAVPMRYSGHNLSILKALDDRGLLEQVKVVEMNPPDMAAALSANALDAYYVGEPFAAKTLKSGDASLFHYVEEVWPGFICNLVVVREDFIENDPESVRALVEGAVRSGIWARSNMRESAKIAAGYWNQPVDLVEFAMSTPEDRIVYDRYTPVEEEMQLIADLMLRYDLLKNASIDGLIDDRFAKGTDLSGINDDIRSIVK